MTSKNKWLGSVLSIVACGSLFLGMIAIGLFLGLGLWLPLICSLLLWIALRFNNVRTVHRLTTGFGFLFLAAAWYLSLRPSNDREWVDELEELASVQYSGSELEIENFRNFHWRSEYDFDKRWERRRFDLDKLESLELMVEPFGDSEYAAHVMLGFGFSDGKRLVVSVEARREKGEEYSLLTGAARKFELAYIFASEEDMLTLRADKRNSRLFAFPVRSDCEFQQRLLVELCESANALHESPRFYATLRDNCATTLLKHANGILAKKIVWQKEVILPAMLGKLLYRLNLMDTNLSMDEAMLRYRIDENVRRNVGVEEFSTRIREAPIN